MRATAARIDVARRTSSTSAARSRAPRAGRSYVVRAADGTPLANACPGVAQGPPRRRPGRAQGVPGLGRQDRDEPRPGPLPRRRADGGPARPVRRRGRGRPRGCATREAREVVDRAIDRWVWYAGWADKIAQVLGLVEPGRARRTSTSRSPSRPASSASSRPRRRRCWASCRGWRRRSSRGNAAVVLASETRPLPAVTLTEVLATSRRPGRRRQRPDRPQARSSCRSSRPTSTSTRIDVWGVPDDLRTDGELAAADNVKRLARRPRASRREVRLARRSRRGAPGVDRRVPRDEDRLAPDRGLTP